MNSANNLNEPGSTFPAALPKLQKRAQAGKHLDLVGLLDISKEISQDNLKSQPTEPSHCKFVVIRYGSHRKLIYISSQVKQPLQTGQESESPLHWQ